MTAQETLNAYNTELQTLKAREAQLPSLIQTATNNYAQYLANYTRSKSADDKAGMDRWMNELNNLQAELNGIKSRISSLTTSLIPAAQAAVKAEDDRKAAETKILSNTTPEMLLAAKAEAEKIQANYATSKTKYLIIGAVVLIIAIAGIAVLKMRR